MSSLRCQCCHRYAPKAVLGVEDGKVVQGEPLGECRGHTAIEEARRWALVWKARAMEMGYGQVKVRVDPTMPPNSMAIESSVDRVTVVNLGPNPELLMEDKPAPSKKLDAKTLTNDEKLHAKWIEEGKDLAYCQGPRRHFFIVGSPMWDQLVEAGCFHCGSFPR